MIGSLIRLLITRAGNNGFISVCDEYNVDIDILWNVHIHFVACQTILSNNQTVTQHTYFKWGEYLNNSRKKNTTVEKVLTLRHPLTQTGAGLYQGQSVRARQYTVSSNVRLRQGWHTLYLCVWIRGWVCAVVVRVRPRGGCSDWRALLHGGWFTMLGGVRLQRLLNHGRNPPGVTFISVLANTGTSTYTHFLFFLFFFSHLEILFVYFPFLYVWLFRCRAVSVLCLSLTHVKPHT